MIVEQKLRDIQARASDIETQMNSGAVSGDELTKMSKEYSKLSEILPLINQYCTLSGKNHIFLLTLRYIQWLNIRRSRFSECKSV